MTEVEFGKLVIGILEKVCSKKGLEFEDFGDGLNQKILPHGEVVYEVREFRKGLLTFEEIQMHRIKLCLWKGGTTCDSESVQTTVVQDHDVKRLETDIEGAVDRLVSAQKELSVAR